MKPIKISVKMDKLMDHYSRVCKRNLRAKCKCCAKCPFTEAIRIAIVLGKEEKK